MSTTRAKFKVESITQESYGTDGLRGTTIKMQPVYSDKPDSENKSFWEATPTGSIELSIDNVNATKLFKVGKSYYVDFSEAPSE